MNLLVSLHRLSLQDHKHFVIVIHMHRSMEVTMRECKYLVHHIRACPGGSLGSRDPPPEVYQRSQKNDVLV